MSWKMSYLLKIVRKSSIYDYFSEKYRKMVPFVHE